MANMGAQVATQANGTKGDKRRQKVSTRAHAGQLGKGCTTYVQLSEDCLSFAMCRMNPALQQSTSRLSLFSSAFVIMLHPCGVVHSKEEHVPVIII